MKVAKVGLILLLVAFCAPSLCSAGCYVQRGGCWYWYSNGCYSRAQYYPKQTTYAAAATTQTAGQAIAAIAGKKAEWQFITESIRQLFPPGGQSVAQGGPGNYTAPGYVQRGSSILSYGTNQGNTVQSFSAVQPATIDIDALIERSTRLATQAQDDGRDATAQAQGLIGQVQAGQMAVAQTFAQAARELAIVQALKPIPPQNVTHTQEYHSNTTNTAQPMQAVELTDEAALAGTSSALEASTDAARLQLIVSSRCVSCHGAESPKGGFNLAGDTAALSKDQLYKMLVRVSLPDGEQRMPFEQPPLPANERLVILNQWAARQ